MRAANTWWPVASVLASLACAPEFDPPSEIEGLRVLAVQKDRPYARPGEDVTLTMLWHDAAEEPRSPQILWLGGCRNPAGDLFAGCFEAFANLDVASARCEPDSEVSVCVGSSFTFRMPDTIISERPAPQDPRQPRYGLSYVFFAACAGHIGPAPGGDAAEFPLACFEDEAFTRRLGPDRFVAGYTAVYAYESIRNANPVVTGFQVEGTPIEPICIGPECAAVAGASLGPVDCQSGVVPCVAACEDDGKDSCPKIEIQPIVDRGSVEPDHISSNIESRDLDEQMWINYYVDGGSVASDVRHLNDALRGWNTGYGTDFRAPRKKGPVNVWAVVHDNRGGVEWVRARIEVY